MRGPPRRPTQVRGSVSVGRGKERTSERDELPRLEAFDGPATFGRESDEDLGAVEAEQQVERKLRSQPDPQLAASCEHLVDYSAHPVQAPIHEALPGECHVRIDTSRGLDGGQQRADAAISLPCSTISASRRGPVGASMTSAIQSRARTSSAAPGPPPAIVSAAISNSALVWKVK